MILFFCINWRGGGFTRRSCVRTIKALVSYFTLPICVCTTNCDFCQTNSVHVCKVRWILRKSLLACQGNVAIFIIYRGSVGTWEFALRFSGVVKLCFLETFAFPAAFAFQNVDSCKHSLDIKMLLLISGLRTRRGCLVIWSPFSCVFSI